jgi:hypothetical protein
VNNTNEPELEERIRLLKKELEALTQQVDQLQVVVRRNMTVVKIELAAIMALMNEISPELRDTIQRSRRRAA